MHHFSPLQNTRELLLLTTQLTELVLFYQSEQQHFLLTASKQNCSYVTTKMQPVDE